jgi:hypothetical protein
MIYSDRPRRAVSSMEMDVESVSHRATCKCPQMRIHRDGVCTAQKVGTVVCVKKQTASPAHVILEYSVVERVSSQRARLSLAPLPLFPGTQESRNLKISKYIERFACSRSNQSSPFPRCPFPLPCTRSVPRREGSDVTNNRQKHAKLSCYNRWNIPVLE